MDKETGVIHKRLESRHYEFTDVTSDEHVDFPSGPVVKNLPASAGDTGSIPDPGRSHMPRGNEHSYWTLKPQLLKSTCLESVLHSKRRRRAEKLVIATRE